MEITKEAIEKRIATLQEHHERLSAELGATFGAIKDCEWWLGVLEAASDSVADDK